MCVTVDKTEVDPLLRTVCVSLLISLSGSPLENSVCVTVDKTEVDPLLSNTVDKSEVDPLLRTVCVSLLIKLRLIPS